MNDIAIQQIEAVQCCKCGVVFGLESEHHRLLKKRRGTFYCPNGHGQHYTGRKK